MLISIGNYKLVDGTPSGGLGLTGLRFSVRRKIQIVEPLRAEQAEPINRGNKITTCRFSVIRNFATQDTADVFLLMHESDLPDSGLVTFIAIRSNGQRVLRYLTAGVIESQDMTPQIGLTTVHSYTLVGGLMTTA
jgi:hypothetical protein